MAVHSSSSCAGRQQQHLLGGTWQEQQQQRRQCLQESWETWPVLRTVAITSWYKRLLLCNGVCNRGSSAASKQQPAEQQGIATAAAEQSASGLLLHAACKVTMAAVQGDYPGFLLVTLAACNSPGVVIADRSRLARRVTVDA